MAPSMLQCRLYHWDEEFTSFRENFSLDSENESFDQCLERGWVDHIGIDVLDKEDKEQEGLNTLKNNEATPDENGVDSENEDENFSDCYMEGETVRNFMRVESTRYLEFLDQAEKVEGFCKDVSLKVLEGGSYVGSQRTLALLDDREIPRNELVSCDRESRRKHLGPLTHMELLKQLSGKRFRVGPECPILGTQPNADRRLLYIETLDPWSVLVLAKTSSFLQMPVLRRMIYGHLTARTWFSVHIPPRGFKTFSLELSISYCCLRSSDERKPILDRRLDWGGTNSLRKSWEVPRLLVRDVSPRTEQKFYNMYEGQISFSVSGIDHWRWTARAFVDAWFPQSKTIRMYHQETDGVARPDPIAAGLIDLDPPELNPRLYFLKVFEIRIQEVRAEWDFVLQRLSEEVKRTKECLLPLSRWDLRNEEDRKKVKALDAWNNEMTNRIGDTLGYLSKTLIAWDAFVETDIGYFVYDGVTSTNQTVWPLSLRVVEKQILCLNSISKELEQLRKELKELGRELVNRLEIENNNTAFLQYEAGEHVKLLTWITIGWSPVIIASSLCSTQDGIIPFRKNIWDFVGSLLVLTVFVALTVVALLNSSRLNHIRYELWKYVNSTIIVGVPPVKQIPRYLIKLLHFSSPTPVAVPNQFRSENIENDARLRVASALSGYLTGLWRDRNLGDPEARLEMSNM